METLLLAVNGMVLVALTLYACFIGVKIDFLLGKVARLEARLDILKQQFHASITRNS